MAAQAGPDPTEPRRQRDDWDENLTADQAAQNLREGLGAENITWEREFRHHTDSEGKPILVDPQTGQVYDTLPNLHPSDGKPV